MSKRIEVKKGDRYGRWIIIKEVNRQPVSGNRMVLARCECGTVKTVRYADIVNDRSMSCGCLNKEAITSHNQTYHPLYHTWKGMMARCYKKNNHNYKRYGQRGIKVCKECHCAIHRKKIA